MFYIKIYIKIQKSGRKTVSFFSRVIINVVQ